MENRKETNDKIVKWITDRVRSEYANDISIVAIYGSYINGTANSKSDVDCYFIPKTDRGYEFETGFIIDGVGYDVFPMSWERVAGIADLKECLIPLVGDARIIYYGDTSDLERFRSLQIKLKNNLADDEYVKEIAEQRCEFAKQMCDMMKVCGNMSGVRKAAGHAIMALADAVAIYNHDYYHYGLKKQYEDLKNNFKSVPESIVTGYENVIRSQTADETKERTLELFKNVCDCLHITVDPVLTVIPDADTVRTVSIDAPSLARLYEEISSTFNKIYVCRESGDCILAFLSAVNLQRELDDAIESGCPSYDLLGSFDYKDLLKLEEQTRKTEEDFVVFIKNNGGIIRSYDDFDTFAKAGL